MARLAATASARALELAKQVGVIERDGRAIRERPCDRDVVLTVASLRFGRGEGDGARGLTGGEERHGDVRDEPDGFDEARVLFVVRSCEDQLARDVRESLRIARPNDAFDGVLVVRARRIAALQIFDEANLLGIDVRHRQSLDAAVDE